MGETVKLYKVIPLLMYFLLCVFFLLLFNEQGKSLTFSNGNWCQHQIYGHCFSKAPLLINSNKKIYNLYSGKQASHSRSAINNSPVANNTHINLSQ